MPWAAARRGIAGDFLGWRAWPQTANSMSVFAIDEQIGDR